MTDVHAMPEPVRLSQTLKASLRAGSTVGAFAGLFDGLVRTLGVDSGLFLIRLQEEGVWPALTHGAPSLDDLPGLLGCTAAAVTLYVSALSVLAVAAGPAEGGGEFESITQFGSIIFQFECTDTIRNIFILREAKNNMSGLRA